MEKSLKNLNRDLLESIARRALYLSTQMIHIANHRNDKEKGDPKIGGHPAACASSLHVLGALHLVTKTGFDFIANKPHASPMDHAYNYLLELFLKSDLSKMSQEDCDIAMTGLRKYSKNGEPVFQSYHSAYDCDHHNFFPSGTVGIPPVQAGYMALAYRYAREHGYEVPDAHFWALAGDSEFREGSMYEAMPDFAERELKNVTWIIDYNRQSLDGHRITNKKIMNGTDADRIQRTQEANGWKVIQLRHGAKRKALFQKPNGALFQAFLEKELEDYELQALLLVADIKALKKGVLKDHSHLKKFLDSVTDQELFEALRDFGGHDIMGIIEAMMECRNSKNQPTLIVAHTLKGWGLKSAAQSGNHSSLPGEDEVEELRQKQNIKGDKLFERFSPTSAEGTFLKERGDNLLKEIKAQHLLKDKNQKIFLDKFSQWAMPHSLDINLKMASYPHTQWMLGQLTAKLTRIANTDENKKPLPENEKAWKAPSELFAGLTEASDVATSAVASAVFFAKLNISKLPQRFRGEAQLPIRDSPLRELV